MLHLVVIVNCLTLWRPLLPYGYGYKASCSVPDRFKLPFVNFDIRAHGATECLYVKNYKWRLNPVWRRMLYICSHMVSVDAKGLIKASRLALQSVTRWDRTALWHENPLTDTLTHGEDKRRIFQDIMQWSLTRISRRQRIILSHHTISL